MAVGLYSEGCRWSVRD